MDVIYGMGIGGGRGSQVNIQRTFSYTHFEFWVTPNKIYYLHVSQNTALQLNNILMKVKYRKFKLKKTKDEKCIFYKKSELNLALTQSK